VNERDAEFELDLTMFGAPESTDEAREASISGDFQPRASITPAQRLEELLAPYGYESTDKARELLRRGLVQPVEGSGQTQWFNVQGSKLYVVKITRGEDFLFAECSCPNGSHRGGDANCYHSIAARVLESGLAATWLEG